MNRWIAWALGAVLLLGIGFWLGRSASPDTEKIRHIEDTLADLERNELAEYRSLKAQDEKLKKAEEILSKVMALFLLDLGERFKKVEAEPAYTLPGAREPDPVPNLETEPPPPPSSQSTSPVKQAPVPQSQSVERVEGTVNAETLAKNVRENFGAVLTGSFRPSKDDALFARLNGKYSGLVALVNPAANWTLNFQVNGRLSNNRYLGTATLSLFDGPRRLAWRQEKNSITMLRRSAPGSDSLILEISEDYYAELFFREMDFSFVGNFYEKKGPNKFVHRGTVSLFRTE